MPRLKRLRRLRDERGLTIPFVALLLPALMVIAALVVDIGNGAQVRRQTQNAADAAAMAAAQDLPTAATARVTARNYAAKNMGLASSALASASCTAPVLANQVCYQTSDGRIRVAVTTPYQGDSQRVNVRVCRTVPTTFGRIAGKNELAPCGRATGSRVATAGATGPAILALNPGLTGFDLASSGQVNITGGGGFVINSGAVDAMKVASGAVTVASPGKLEIYGSCKDCNKATLSPTNSKLTAPYPDPYLSLPVPPNPGGTCRSGSGGANRATFTNVTMTIGPSCFSSRFDVDNNSTLTLQPGVYWLNSGLRWAANLQTTTTPVSPITGTGVLIYNAAGASQITSGANIQLKPPSSGTYHRVTYFQARTNTSDFTVSGSNPYISWGDPAPNGGVFYMPGAGKDSVVREPRLTFNATGANWTNGGIVVQSLYVGGTSAINGHTPGGAGSYIGEPQLSLVE